MRTYWTNERIVGNLTAENPEPDECLEGLGRSTGARQLLEQILHTHGVDLHESSESALAADTARSEQRPTALPSRPSAPRPTPRVLVAAVLTIALAAAIALPLSFESGSGRSGPTISAAHPAEPFVPANPAHTRTGRWRLLDAVLNGRWQQNTGGPPPGLLSCAATSACYVMAGNYSSPLANTPPLSESLYATSTLGTAWTVEPMPAGFQPTSPLSCPEERTCAAGGTVGGSSALVVTTDGGSRWTTSPVSGFSGDLVELTCLSSSTCDGIAGPSWASAEHPAGDLLGTPSASPNESFVATLDGGRSWSASSLPASEYVEDFYCTSAESCLVMGREASTTAGPDEADFVIETSDAGRTWKSGALPEGFTLGPISDLSCATSTDCFVTGMVPVTPANPPLCPPSAQRLPHMSPAVAAISRIESRLWSQSAAKEAEEGGGFSCVGGGAGPTVSDIVSTNDGGLTWTPDALPSNVPQPSISDIACASATTCWASGSEAVLQRIGSAVDAGSRVLLGTTDGGQTWSKVVFSVPAGAPNPYGQSYLSIGDLECPQTTACIALGDAAQSASVAPVYSFVSVPGR
ncbi:MAG: hypothetical protein ACRDZ5_07780 [Acidimicrobiales bacterium]